MLPPSLAIIYIRYGRFLVDLINGSHLGLLATRALIDLLLIYFPSYPFLSLFSRIFGLASLLICLLSTYIKALVDSFVHVLVHIFYH